MNRFLWLDFISEDNSIIWAMLGLPGTDEDEDEDDKPLELLLMTGDGIEGGVVEVELELVGD